MRNLQIATSITDRTESFNTWGKMIRDYDMVSAEEEAVLAQRIQKGDKRAADKLVCANLRFVISVAKHYQNQGLDLVDLIQEGNIGLIEAAQNFDASLGYKFISYAIFYIRRSILNAIYRNGTLIRKSNTHLRSVNRINDAINAFEQKNERTPNLDELAEITGISSDKLYLFMGQNYNATSAEAPLSEDGGCLYDLLSDSDAKDTDSIAEYNSLVLSINTSLDRLTLREKDVLCKFFGIGQEPMGLKEIGKLYHLNHESIRQIKNKALAKLREDGNLQALATAC